MYPRKTLLTNLLSDVSLPLTANDKKTRIYSEGSLAGYVGTLVNSATQAQTIYCGTSTSSLINHYKNTLKHINNMSDQFKDLQCLFFVRKNIKSPMERPSA